MKAVRVERLCRVCLRETFHERIGSILRCSICRNEVANELEAEPNPPLGQGGSPGGTRGGTAGGTLGAAAASSSALERAPSLEDENSVDRAVHVAAFAWTVGGDDLEAL